MYSTNKGRYKYNRERKITMFEIKQTNKIKIFFKEQDFAIRVRIMYIKIDEIGNMMKKWKT